MKLSVKSKVSRGLFEVTIESGDTKIVNDVSQFVPSRPHNPVVPREFVSSLEDALFEAYDFNGLELVEAMAVLVRSKLNSREIDRLIERLDIPEGSDVG